MFYFNKTDFEFNLPDPRWEEPNLLIPGKKPTGPVTIDWSHPLARGLSSFLIAENSLTDLAGGLSSPAPSASTEYVEATRHGLAHYTGNSYTDLSASGFFLNKLGHTLFATFSAETLENWCEIVSYIPSAGISNRSAISKNASGKIFIQENASWTGTYAVNFPTGAWCTFVGTVEYNGSNHDHKYWVFNHDTKSLQTDSYTGSANVADFNIASAKLGIGNNDPTREFVGHVACAGIFGSTVLSGSAAESLARNPYQFLIPA